MTLNTAKQSGGNLDGEYVEIETDGRLSILHFKNATTGEEDATILSLGSGEEEMVNPLEAMLIFYLILIAMLGAQMGLVVWRHRHKRSYELVSLIGLWLVPAIVGYEFGLKRFVVVWALYSVLTAYILSFCLRQHIAVNTPRKIYGWFLLTHKISTGMGMAGYVMLLTGAMGLQPLYNLIFPADLCLTLLGYGIYFGILSRDLAEVASDRLHANMGGTSNLTRREGMCGICDQPVRGATQSLMTKPQPREPAPPGAGAFGPVDKGGGGGGGEHVLAQMEETVTLTCGHKFHDLCIRGWIVVGKKDTCPVCNDKVNLSTIWSASPWQGESFQRWNSQLDVFRYLLVWNPILLFGIHIIFHMIGLDKAPEHGHHMTNGTMDNSTHMGYHHHPGNMTLDLINSTLLNSTGLNSTGFNTALPGGDGKVFNGSALFSNGVLRNSISNATKALVNATKSES